MVLPDELPPAWDVFNDSGSDLVAFSQKAPQSFSAPDLATGHHGYTILMWPVAPPRRASLTLPGRPPG